VAPLRADATIPEVLLPDIYSIATFKPRIARLASRSRLATEAISLLEWSTALL